MASWRDSASPQVQQDLDELLNVALGFAQQQLDTHGEFFPYAAAIDRDGQAEMIAARPDPDDEHPESAAVIDACVAALRDKRDQIRGAAIVADVHARELGTDAINVDLEHAEGATMTVLLPYAKKRLRRSIEYGDLRAQPGRQRIWQA